MKTIIQHKWILLIITVVTTLIASCGAPARYQDLSHDTKYEVLQFPVLSTYETYQYIIWPEDGRVKSFIAKSYALPENQPYVIEGDPTVHYLGLESDKECTLFTEYVRLTSMPDGRLGFIKTCQQGTRNPTSLGPVKSYLFAYEWETGTVEQIVKEPLPHPIRSGCFSWNPEMTRAIQGTYDSYLSGGLYWLTRNGSEPLDLVLQDDGQTWDLGKSYVAMGESINEGIASCASWSPDGANIAFFATLKSIGLEGFERGGKPFDLYLYSVSDGKAERLLTDIYSPYNVQWSPDSTKIAFLGKLSNDERERTNLWVIDIKTRQLFLIATGFFGRFTWSPNSNEIAVISCSDILCRDNKNIEIRKYPIKLPK